MDQYAKKGSRIVTSMATTLSVLERFLLGGREGAVDAVFSWLTPDVIFRLRYLSTPVFYAIEAYIVRQWDVKEFLGRWFHNVDAFLTTLALCDGVVSGSEAMQFFGRREFRGNDLDIFVPAHGLLTMGRYARRCGFVFQPTSDKHPFFDAAALLFCSRQASGARRHHKDPSGSYSFSTFSFLRPVAYRCCSAMHASRLQIIAVRGNPVEYLVNNFHSSKQTKSTVLLR